MLDAQRNRASVSRWKELLTNLGVKIPDVLQCFVQFPCIVIVVDFDLQELRKTRLRIEENSGGNAHNFLSIAALVGPHASSDTCMRRSRVKLKHHC